MEDGDSSNAFVCEVINLDHLLKILFNITSL